MVFLADMIYAVVKVLDILISMYIWVFVINAVLSWVHPDPSNPIVRTLDALTEPVLSRIRRLIPFAATGLDFSPIVAVLVLIFTQEFLIRALRHLAERVAG